MDVSSTVFVLLTSIAKNSLFLHALQPCVSSHLRGSRQNFWMKLIAQKPERWGHRVMKIALSYL